MTSTLVRPAFSPTQDRGSLGGYAMVFTAASHPIRSDVVGGTFVERIAPWAIDDAALAGFRGVVALHNHDVNQALGSVDTDTLALQRDRIGLRFALPVNDVAPLSGLIYSRVREGKGTGMSFGFRATAARWGLDAQGNPTRLVQGMDLLEISVLTRPAVPAYPSTVLAAIIPVSQRNARMALVRALELAA